MNLAIKGHQTRGKEVIEILEMMGGINHFHMDGFTEEFIYYICGENNQIHSAICQTNQIVFTLEEFLEKYPYKIGDKVSSKYLKNYEVSKMEWESSDNRVIYKLQGMGWYSADELQPYKKEVMDKAVFDANAQCCDIMNHLIKKETMEEQKKDYEEWFQINYLEFENNDDTWGDEVEVNLGKDYEIQIRGDKTFIVKKQLQYPKTYEECCKVLSLPLYYNLRYHTYEYGYGEFTTIDKLCSLQDKLNTLGKLLICRDAYWKIAGNWEEKRKEKAMHYIICSTLLGEVAKDTMPNCIANYLLDFPTKEMRDIFFENFKDLIEQCKELL